MDLKNVLNSNTQSDNIQIIKKNNNYSPHVNKSNANNNYSQKNEIDELLKKEKLSLYHKSWNKLDNSTKNNLLKKFISIEKEQNNLNEKQTLLLTNLLIKNIKKLNKISDVNYDQDSCNIININNLTFNPDDKSYTLNIIEKKSKPPSQNKSKSKLDKFIK